MALSDALKRLVEQARTDPAFFHELVFDPEKVIGRLKYLDRKTKAALLKVDPSALIANLVPPDSTECGSTCGAGSCTGTCGAGSCIDTCGSSCGSTCSNSCDHTSGMGLNYIPDDPQKTGGLLAGVRTIAGKTVATAKTAKTAKARSSRKRRG